MQTVPSTSLPLAIRLRTATPWYYLAALATCLLYFANLHFHPELSADGKMDQYFGGDNPRVLDNLRDSGEWSHLRDKVHPFFSIIAVSVARIPSMLGFPGTEFPFYRLVFGTAGCLLFFDLVFAEAGALQAFASLAVLLSTMSLRVWSTLPESFLFGFATIMLSLFLVRRGAHPVLVLLTSMASATTNIALGVIHAVRTLATPRQYLAAGLTFLTVAVAIDTLQASIYPTSDYFFDVLSVSQEARYLTHHIAYLPFRAFDFLFSGFVMPLYPSLKPPIDARTEWAQALVSGFMSKRGALMLLLALAGVLALYVASMGSFLRSRARSPVLSVAAGFILFEFVFHLGYGDSLYGDSPFLYSLHYTPVVLLFFSLSRPVRLQPAYPAAFLGLAIALQFVNLYNFQAIFG